VSPFSHVDELEVLRIWEGVHGRAVAGSEATLAWIELEPGTVVPEHQHLNEQTGILVRGALTFTVGGETRELRPGSMWVIPADVPHMVVAGPEGASLAELFSPPREDWAGLERSPARPVTLS
jgi:quercetin dioxygenase-like cupin family protein